jgi:predicted ester cyclase
MEIKNRPKGRPPAEQKSMSREQKVAAVEAYLDCFATKDLSKVPFAEDVTFEGPRMPKLTGRATILGFLTQILPMVRGIQVKQHIVEGDYVATVFDMETVNGVDHVFDRINTVDGQIKAIHAFYYPEQPPEGSRQ